MLATLTSSAIVLDFAAAFSSLKHRGIRRVPRLMCLPATLARLVEASYRDLRTTTVFGGEAVGEIRVTAGIRPGSPLNGTLFARTVEPLVRAYAANVALHRSRLCLFVDDLAIAMMLFFSVGGAPLACACKGTLLFSSRRITICGVGTRCVAAARAFP